MNDVFSKFLFPVISDSSPWLYQIVMSLSLVYQILLYQFPLYGIPLLSYDILLYQIPIWLYQICYIRVCYVKICYIKRTIPGTAGRKVKLAFQKLMINDSCNLCPKHTGPDAILVRRSGTIVPGPSRAVPDSILHDED